MTRPPPLEWPSGPGRRRRLARLWARLTRLSGTELYGGIAAWSLALAILAVMLAFYLQVRPLTE